MLVYASVRSAKSFCYYHELVYYDNKIAGAVLTSPEERTLFMYSRKASSLISLSVKMKVMPLPSPPDVRYKYLRSSIRLLTLYVLREQNQYLNIFSRQASLSRKPFLIIHLHGFCSKTGRK